MGGHGALRTASTSKGSGKGKSKKTRHGASPAALPPPDTAPRTAPAEAEQRGKHLSLLRLVAQQQWLYQVLTLVICFRSVQAPQAVLPGGNRQIVSG